MNQLTITQQRLGISRAELCRRLGLSPNAATKYALGRQDVPRYVILACLALEHGLDLPEQTDLPPQRG